MSNGLFRLRVSYLKRGRLAYLSHLELIRALERAIRRSDLPYAITQGFHPHMKIAFGPALPVGCAGVSEYLDVWLTRFVEPPEVLAALSAASPPDLAPVEASYVSEAEKSLTAALVLSTYEVYCTQSDKGDLADEVFVSELRRLFEHECAAGEILVPGKKKDRIFDLATVLWKSPQVEEVHRRGSSCGALVGFGIRTSNEGSLRPDAYLTYVNGRFAEKYGAPFETRELTRTGLFPEPQR